MPGRNLSAGNSYRYGFNRKENDKSITNDDYDFGARIYDGRVGRWLSVDPLQSKYPNETPYLYTGGNPVYFIDVDGRDRIQNNIYKDQKGNVIKRTEIIIYNSWDIVSKKWESSTSVMGGGSSLITHYDWYHVGYDVTHVLDENGKEISVNKGADYAYGKALTTTDGDPVFDDGSGWAGLKIASTRKDGKGYGGIVMYARNGQGKETRIGTYATTMVEVTALLAATGNAKETALDEILLQINEHNDEQNEKNHPNGGDVVKNPKQVIQCESCKAFKKDGKEIDTTGKGIKLKDIKRVSIEKFHQQ